MIVEKHMLVLFGSTGDLTRRKILPALYSLFEKGTLTRQCPIVCFGRQELTTEEFVKGLDLEKYLKKYDQEILLRFFRQLQYVRLDLRNFDSATLKQQLHRIATAYQAGANKLFYLALPPGVFGQAVNVIQQFVDDDGWYRVVFEKPFGQDRQSAQKLNDEIRKVLDEEQIYRVDHYLGKELVQNIFTLRFHNEIFKWVWHKDAIDHVQIIASESLGVEDRAGYYDKSGAVRDMVQNHLLQLLSLVAMEPPSGYDEQSIRDATGKVMQKLRPVKKDDVVLGQYEGYVDAKGVDPHSTTETFAAFRVFIDSPRWQGVPFYLKTGKKLNERYADIKVVFKHDRELCRQGDCDQPNVIVIRIQPDDGIGIAFNVRSPENESITESVLMDFCHHCYFGPNTPEAYESILVNVMQGEATVFPRWDWIDASWTFIDQFLVVAEQPLLYTKGSTGPVESNELLIQDGRNWLHGEMSPESSKLKRSVLRPLSVLR